MEAQNFIDDAVQMFRSLERLERKVSTIFS
jgi:hypothetical protein